MNNTRLEKLITKADDKRTLAETNELITLLVKSNTTLGKAVLQLRDVMSTHKEAIELLTGMVAPSTEREQLTASVKLVGFDIPKLELN